MRETNWVKSDLNNCYNDGVHNKTKLNINYLL